MNRYIFLLANWLSNIVGFKPSHLYPSPSKFYLLRKLRYCLDQSIGMSVGADVACADFKYRELFKTRRYVGIDLDRTNLTKGLALRAKHGDVGVLANLLDLGKIPPFADVLVSTHTIASLPFENQVDAVRILAKAVIQNGTLFFNVPTSKHCDVIEDDLHELFGDVKRIVYGNPIFMGIEAFFAYRTGSKNPLYLILLGFVSIICYILSFLEEIPIFRLSGRYTLFYCKNRIGSETDNSLELIKGLSHL